MHYMSTKHVKFPEHTHIRTCIYTVVLLAAYILQYIHITFHIKLHGRYIYLYIE